jgi:hypothetical protein
MIFLNKLLTVKTHVLALDMFLLLSWDSTDGLSCNLGSELDLGKSRRFFRAGMGNVLRDPSLLARSKPES